MDELLMTPDRYRGPRKQVLRIGGETGHDGLVTGRTVPADRSRLFATVSEAGVSLYSSEVEGDRFRLSIYAHGDETILVTSDTPWTEEGPFLHEDPPFGEPDVRYALDVERNGAWTRAGQVRIDLSAYILAAPEIDIEDSYYNAPFVHVALVWNGNDTDLEAFQIEAELAGVWTVLIRTPERIAHVDIGQPPEDLVKVRARANGIRFGASPYSAELILTNDPAADGDGVGDGQLRSNEDHRRITGNLCQNSSFELQDPDTLDVLEWQIVNGQPDTAAWPEKHGTNHLFLDVNGTAQQTITARLSNTDIHSCSVEAQYAGGQMIVWDLDGSVIDAINLLQGVNTIEGFRVPSEHKGFTIELVGPCAVDKIQVNQGPTVDPWVLDSRDQLLALILDLQQTALDIRDQLVAYADQMEADFDTVFAIMGGESGSVITQHEDNINLIVAALNGDNSGGQFTWINQTASNLTLISQDLLRIDGELQGARSDLTLLTDRVDDPETGLANLHAELTAHAGTLVELGDDIAGAIASITAVSDTVYDPVLGNVALDSALGLLTNAHNSLNGQFQSTQADFNLLSSAFYDPVSGLGGTRSELQANITATNGLESELDGAQVEIQGLAEVVADPVIGNETLRTLYNTNTSAISTLEGDMFAAETQISQQSLLITDNTGRITGLESEVVLKALVNASNEMIHMAMVRLDASASGGSNILLTANNILIDGSLGIIDGLNNGITKINGGRINASDAIVAGTGSNQVYIGGPSGQIVHEDLTIDVTAPKSGGAVIRKTGGPNFFELGPSSLWLKGSAGLVAPAGGNAYMSLDGMTLQPSGGNLASSAVLEAPNIALSLPSSNPGGDQLWVDTNGFVRYG